jgi:putative redox protein
MSLSLIWDADLKFHAGPDGPSLDLDSNDPAVVSPMQGLAYALMGCMGMDVVHILQKGRHDLKGLLVSFDSERAATAPKRYTKIHLTFHVTGDIAEDVVRRAIDLSHEKYCSVSNSLREDIVFETSVTITK